MSEGVDTGLLRNRIGRKGQRHIDRSLMGEVRMEDAGHVRHQGLSIALSIDGQGARELESGEGGREGGRELGCGRGTGRVWPAMSCTQALHDP